MTLSNRFSRALMVAVLLVATATYASAQSTKSSTKASTKSASAKAASADLIDLNSASRDDLMNLRRFSEPMVERDETRGKLEDVFGNVYGAQVLNAGLQGQGAGRRAGDVERAVVDHVRGIGDRARQGQGQEAGRIDGGGPGVGVRAGQVQRAGAQFEPA